MKNKKFSMVLFAAAFVGTYLALCFGVPSWRIKLEAEAAAYFLASVQHMMPLKMIVSALVGIWIGYAPALFKK